MREGGEGERFLAAFSKLKAELNDDPARLDAVWEDGDQVARLCDELARLVRGFELIEEWSPLAFTNNVSAAGAKARRDYDERWRNGVRKVADRKLNAAMEAYFAKYFGGEDEKLGGADANAVVDALGASISEWKDEAAEEANLINQIIDHAWSEYDSDVCGDFDWVRESLVAWDRLKVSGLDIEGTLWRRRAIPHILVPSHVSKRYCTQGASLYARLHDAGKAFIFGAPLAALGMQRAVMEEVLTKHWGAPKTKRGFRIADANLPENIWNSRADRLKNLANDALHDDPRKLSPEAVDRSIIENFLLLRLLIEHAPEDLRSHGGSPA